MDNQHKMIKGYRDLSKEEIQAMNDIKAMESNIAEFLTHLPNADGRWLSIAKIHFQQGFMAAVRAIAKPDSPWD